MVNGIVAQLPQPGHKVLQPARHVPCLVPPWHRHCCRLPSNVVSLNLLRIYRFPQTCWTTALISSSYWWRSLKVSWLTMFCGCSDELRPSSLVRWCPALCSRLFCIEIHNTFVIIIVRRICYCEKKLAHLLLNSGAANTMETDCEQ